MKLNKLFLGLLGLMTITFAACSDDDDYTRATISGNQVYFSNQLPSTQDVLKSANSFTIPVNRQETTEAITVPLKVSGEAISSGIYNVPTSVSFPAGSNTANLVVTYDPERVEYGDYKDIKIELDAENYTTPYGLSAYNFEVGATQWTEWHAYNDDGTADYYYVNLWGGVDEGCKFSVRDNIIEKNLHQFKIDNVMYGIDLVLDYDDKTGIVSFYRSEWTGYTHSSYGNVYIADYNYYWTEVRGQSPTPVYGSFDEKLAIISIPLVYYVDAGYFGQDFEYIYINGVRRADVSCDIAYSGKFFSTSDDPYVCANVTLGKDVTSAMVALVEGELDQETFNSILDGSYQPMQEVTSSCEVRFPADEMEDGLYTFVVVSYIDGEVGEYNYSTFNYQAVASSWESLGIGTYVEDVFVRSFYWDSEAKTFLNPIAYEVEIQENADAPGLYRMVDPYLGLYNDLASYLDGLTYNSSSKNYIQVNAEDPEGVFIDLQPTGLDWDGMFYLYSYAAYYLDAGYGIDAAKEAGRAGKLENGHITFPTDCVLYAWEGDDNFYLGNRRGGFDIALPGAASSNKRVMKAHNLSGINRVSKYGTMYDGKILDTRGPRFVHSKFVR